MEKRSKKFNKKNIGVLLLAIAVVLVVSLWNYKTGQDVKSTEIFAATSDDRIEIENKS